MSGAPSKNSTHYSNAVIWNCNHFPSPSNSCRTGLSIDNTTESISVYFLLLSFGSIRRMDGFDVHSKFWYLTPEGLSLSSVSPPEGEKTGKRRLRETEKGRLKLYD